MIIILVRPIIPIYTYHSSGHISSTEELLYVLLFSTIISCYLIYIACVFVTRHIDGYDNRNQFMLSLFIPFRDWILFVIECFKKD